MNLEAPTKNLTQYPQGSIREVWVIAYPLMITMLCTSLMVIADRLILSRYSTLAMNSAAGAGVIFAIFEWGFLGITLIAEVFVGQFNGAKEFKKIGTPVWQMIWFSLMTNIIFIPFAIWCCPWLMVKECEEFGVPYLRYLMLFGMFTSMTGALSAFFIGRGKTKIITLITVFANILNVGLDIVLVFGIQGFIPSLGAAGAAIATGISKMIQCGILFYIFTNKKNREKYDTFNYYWHKPIFLACLRIGWPTAIARVIEIAGWTVFYQVMFTVSNDVMTASVIWNSVFTIMNIPFWGAMDKTVTAIISNLIGSKQFHLIKKTFHSSLKLHGLYLSILFVLLIIYPDWIISLFIKPSDTSINIEATYALTRLVLLMAWFINVFDGIAWILCGILTAARETKFLLYIIILTQWALFIIPLFIGIKYLNMPAIMAWPMFGAIGIFASICFYLRYKKVRWETVINS